MILEEELEVRCLVSDVAHCDYRVARKKYFGYNGPTKCPHRPKLKREFEQYLADIEYAKYKKEHKD